MIECATLARLLSCTGTSHKLAPWWRFNTPRMDYTASPDWYAGAV